MYKWARPVTQSYTSTYSHTHAPKQKEPNEHTSDFKISLLIEIHTFISNQPPPHSKNNNNNNNKTNQACPSRRYSNSVLYNSLFYHMPDFYLLTKIMTSR